MWRSVRLLILVAALAASTRALPIRAAQLAPYPVIPPDQLLRYLDAVERRLDYVPGEALVKFKDGVTPDGHARALQAATGLPQSGALTWVGDVALVRDLAQPDARVLAAELAAQPEVLYAEPNYIGHFDSAPNDPSYATRQWNLQQLNMPRVWDIAPGATADVVVAMIDSGVTAVPAQSLAAKTWSGTAIVDVSVPVAPSPEFALSRFVSPANFIGNPSAPSAFVFDSDGHGTHTGSTVGEGTNNGIALAGIAYNASIMPLKVCETYWDMQFSFSAAGFAGFFPLVDSFCPTSATAAAIRYAADHGAHVINMSLGGYPPSLTLSDALNYAVNHGVFVAISNGNTFTEGNAASYPAAFAPQFEGVMSVAAANRNNSKAWYSTTNSMTEIMAYGGDLTLGSANGVWQMTLRFADSNPETVIFPRFDRYDERSFQGTSMAAPHVAAFAALLHSRGITSPAAKEAVIIATALDIGTNGKDDSSGYGLIQPVKALFGLGVNR